MHHIIRTLTLAATLALIPAAQASSCDPAQPMGVDAKIANYNESNCARKALDSSKDSLRDTAKAEERSDVQQVCITLFNTLMRLDTYKSGEWRAGYKEIADKIDNSFAEFQDKLMRTSCPQKLTLFRHLAAKGDAWAMYNLGIVYSKGIEARQDDAEALAWYQSAAAKDYIPAYLALGLMYSDSVAFLPDYPVAFDWYMKAAAKGDVTAQFNVAGMYRKGLGVNRDPKKAEEWYKKAAAQKHEGAKAKLEEMYKTGEVKKTGFTW